MNKNLIIAAAGSSSRFPNMKPKWLLTHPDGNLMFCSAISGLDLSEFTNIYLVTLSTILDGISGSREGIKRNIKDRYNRDIEIIELKEKTKSQSETVYRALKFKNITGSFLIKDSDGYFEASDFNKNSICFSNIEDNKIKNPHNKSYIVFDKHKKLLNIVEKQIISNFFSVGGYFFESAEDFCSAYEKIIDFESVSEVYVSHVINKLLSEEKKFICKEVNLFKDWGTLEDWEDYKKTFKTFFIDIDWVLFYNSSKYFLPSWGETPALENNIKKIKNIISNNNCQVILTTARDESYKKITEEQLLKIGIKYDKIIFGLFHTKRVIINDFSNTNRYPSCEAINILRDNDDLENYF